MIAISGFDFVKKFEQEVPTWLAMDKDPIGLHVGDLRRTVKKIMVTLDVRPEVVEEAIKENVDFILAHHPPIYRPIARLDLSDAQNQMYAQLIKHDITVYAAHTNLDNANNGMNDWLAEMLQLEDVEIMDVTKTIHLKRLNVYVPYTHVEQVRHAMTNAGAGHITNDYRDCSYSVSGVGRFTPVQSAQPTIGEVGKPEEVAEERIEVIVKDSDLKNVIQAMIQAHPYEEPVFETYTIDQLQPEQFGLGRIGNLANEMDLSVFIEHVKQTFQVEGVRVVAPQNQTDKKVKRVALCGGDAGKYYPKAIQKGADVYITGDVYYHTAHDMQADGLTVIDPGHHIEEICIPKLHEMLASWSGELDWDVEIITSKIDTNPFKFH